MRAKYFGKAKKNENLVISAICICVKYCFFTCGKFTPTCNEKWTIHGFVYDGESVNEALPNILPKIYFVLSVQIQVC
jgi:hypothetical protein